jgi:hypothetical protein
VELKSYPVDTEYYLWNSKCQDSLAPNLNLIAEDSPKNKRRYPRIPTPQGIWVSWNGGSQHGASRVRELNMGRLFISTPGPPPVSTLLTLLLSVPEGEIRTGAVVRNTSPGKGMGVEFTEMGQESAVRLQILIARLVRSMPRKELSDSGSPL